MIALYALFLFVTTCVLLGQQTADAHAQPGMVALPSAECDGDNIDFQSYHIHVLYWQNNQNSTDLALKLRKDFISKFELDETADACTFSLGEPMPEQKKICIFDVDTEPAGPFVTAQYSFFIPTDFFQVTTAWSVAHRTVLDIFIHPNSGCSLQDHLHFGMWSGTKWELDPSCLPWLID